MSDLGLPQWRETYATATEASNALRSALAELGIAERSYRHVRPAMASTGTPYVYVGLLNAGVVETITEALSHHHPLPHALASTDYRRAQLTTIQRLKTQDCVQGPGKAKPRTSDDGRNGEHRPDTADEALHRSFRSKSLGGLEDGLPDELAHHFDCRARRANSTDERCAYGQLPLDACVPGQYGALSALGERCGPLGGARL